MLKVAVLTMIQITNPNSLPDVQEIETSTQYLYAQREYDAQNICRRLGEQYVKAVMNVKNSFGDDMFARVYTCEGSARTAWDLDKSVVESRKKKETK